MHWIHRHQLFLFDFDGLLVNTEEIHYKAYVKMCADRNIDLTWDFFQYSELAHHSATGVRDALYKNFPQLKIEAPDWVVLYEEKKKAFLRLLREGTVELMTGVSELLEALQQNGIRRCVVTHSPFSLVATIRERHPVLNTIPNWITREDYSSPKPDAECYQLAIAKFSQDSDSIIGFEDSPRGLSALRGSRALPVLICPSYYPYVKKIKNVAHRYYQNFDSINEENAP